ncbi:hypothetical protein DAPPUDRAFT_114913 [Daphnia pulex]|uniref:Uncharacterized protein n=1 Tax=Daphnia pulex TaxID=6669 RepID=E9HJP3_DAPPU|nr:hypothetical protein DAPPUDRAFT_114913 [Daphnia pulex]|eukprot:EFX68051.1 hypothetical protein DAPPUDRAFT_114913 [Daphnia pulex]
MASSLRNKDWLIGYSHRTSLATASKLPTKGVVLARFKCIQDEKKGQHIDIFREIFAELKVVWERADVEQKLKASHNPNAAVDFKFLLAQREVPQRGFMDRVDEKDIERASRKRKSSSTPTNVETANVSLSLSEESEIVESSSSGETFSDLSRTPRPDSVTLELPDKSLLKATGQAADARNLSVRDHVAIVASTITAGGGDLQQLMSERFEMTEEEIRNVHKMANFIALFHTRPFIQSRLASLAPAVDLRYLSQMIWFKKKYETVGNVAIKSICNHLWYLTEELVVFSFFDESLPNALRESMVKQLLTFNRSKDFPPGKPKFPLINPDEIDYPNQLNLFVGAKSWLLFNLLDIDGEMLDWMQVPVVYWGKMSGYRKLKEIVSAFEVVNNCA